MKSALIRADGSQHLGLGHVMRCLAFAQGLRKTGVESLFITRNYEQRIVEIIHRHKFDTEPMPVKHGFTEDLRLTSELANQFSATLIITDLCTIDTLSNLVGYSEYLQGLKDTGRFLITIDDFNEIAFPSDIVVNPNYGAEKMNYPPEGHSIKFLLGPAYFIFRLEFIKAAGVNRETRNDAHNILVTMGGSDLLDLTVKVAGALKRLIRLRRALNVQIVLGPGYPDSIRREVNEIFSNFSGNLQLLQGSDNMAGLMLWSDLAITGGGLTKYETAVTGTPSIIISQVPHQEELAKEFEKEGTALNLGFGTRVSEEEIAEAVANLLGNNALRAEMSRMGKKLVDGKGIEHIISEIPQEVWS